MVSCISLIVAGLVVFVIGTVKSIKSKLTDLTALIWIWSGVGLINVGTFILGKLL